MANATASYRDETGHFVRWSVQHRHARGLTYRTVRWTGPKDTIDSEKRWADARRLLNDDTLPTPHPLTSAGKRRRAARERWNVSVAAWRDELDRLAEVDIRFVGRGELLPATAVNPPLNGAFRPCPGRGEVSCGGEENHLRGGAGPPVRRPEDGMEKVYDSSDYSACDALDAWAATTADAVMPTLFRLVGTDTFHGCLQTSALGAVQVSVMAYHSFHCVRTAKLIRRADPECFQLAFMRSGRHVLEQSGNRTALRAGEMAVFDSSRPFETWADGESLLVQVPHTLLGLPVSRVHSLVSRPLPAAAGMGRLLGDFLVGVEREGTARTEQDALRLATVCLDLVTAVLAHHLERESEVPAGSRRRVLFLRVTAYIQRRLGDPGLSVESVAAAHHISARSLHRLFQQHGMSVGAWIRSQRMEHCRRELADPWRRHEPVAAIAARWGLLRPADFTRAFRTRYGVTPSDYREQQTHARAADARPVPEAGDAPGT
ncbi:helix-turn-helix domain-containing protein [Streptomyces sp. NPDC003667]